MRDTPRFSWLVLPSMVLVTLTGCAAPPESPTNTRRCSLIAWYRPDQALADPSLGITAEQAQHPELLGSWDGWRRPGLRGWDRRKGPAGPGATGQLDWWVISLPLSPGTYQYGILVGEKLLTDEQNGQSVFQQNPLVRGDAPYSTEVSQLVVPDCTTPVLQASASGSGNEGSFVATADFMPGTGGSGLDPHSVHAELRRGQERLPAPAVSIAAVGDGGMPGTQRITVQEGGLPAGKYTASVHAADGKSNQVAAEASAFVEPRGQADARLLADGVVYELVVDRFRGNGPLPPPQAPGDRAGGTLEGVQKVLETGYFAKLGVTTLWLSPVYTNPPGHFIGRDGRMYQAYHGYWPAAPREVEPQLGGDLQLDQLVAAAHERGIRVILDVVPHHVHTSHPYFQQHSRSDPSVSMSRDPRVSSWFYDGLDACVCGNDHCGWGERSEDCWFDTYLPSIDWRQPDAAQAEAGDLVWWMSRFDLDGLRIDAVPLMPRAATRRMVRDVHGMVQRQGLDQLIVGETYTGPGAYGRVQIRSYLGRSLDGLDSEFDFPLMWSMRDVIAHNANGFDTLEADIQAGDQAWAGSGAVIGHIAGNHDTTRFISEAAGDAGGDPWTQAPPQPSSAEPYQRHFLAMALLLTLPGLPVLYYGDEVGLAGATDPDCRRPLPDVLSPSLPALMAQMLDRVGRLGRLRACLPALRRGTRRVALVDRDHDVVVHEAPAGPAGAQVIVALSRDRNPARLSVSGLPAGSYRDALSGTKLTVVDGPTDMVLAPLSAAVYVQENSPCLTP